ncbi:MAG: hypothetical protein ABH878_00155 [bacterium]
MLRNKKRTFVLFAGIAIIATGCVVLLSCGGGGVTEPIPGLPISTQIVSHGKLPLWSPNGNKVAFGGEGANTGIWVYDYTSGSVAQITDDSYPHLWDYSWSPNGDQIAFGGAGATIENKSGIFTVALNGSAPVRWHHTGSFPYWMPNDQGLIFAENDPESGTYGLFKLFFADTSLVQLTNNGSEPKYNPSGSHIAFRYPGVSLAIPLRIIPAGGGSITTLADTCLHFSWTADGSELVFDYMRYGSDSGLRICSVPAVGGAVSQIALRAGEPALANTGRIAYQYVDSDLSYGIYVVNLDGSENRQVAASGFQPSISPDGTLVVYARSDGLWMVSP